MGLSLYPLGNRIIVKKHKRQEQTTAAGIVLPETSRDKLVVGTVVSVGEGRILDNGSRCEIPLKVTDRVLFPEREGILVPPTVFSVTPEDASALYTAEILILDFTSIVAVMR